MSEPPASPPHFPHAEILADIQREWNAAEECIKRSELIALDISIPAISELRYAGRRIVDALDIAHKGGPEEKIKAVLEDARFCCHRARHDSIDAALSKIAIDLDDMTKRLGYAAVIQAYPDFQILYVAFSEARQKVASSRGDRQNRNAIYDTVAAVDFPHIAERYTNLLVCKPIALSYAAKGRRERFAGRILIVVAILTMLLAGLAVDWSKYGLGHSPVSESVVPAPKPKVLRQHDSGSMTPTKPPPSSPEQSPASAQPAAPGPQRTHNRD